MEENEEKEPRRGPIASAMAGAVSVGANMLGEKFTELKHDADSKRLKASANFPMIRLPEGYEIEKIADGLTYPTSVTWDDRGNMYVAEAGGTFLDEEDASARILRIKANGTATEVANLDGKIYPAISGMTWHNGAFYITHRDRELYGCVSRVTPDGEITQILGGIVDSKSDHQPNDVRVGRDGRMYVCVGIGGNSGYMDENMIPFVLKAPDGHPTPARDIVLTGYNIELPDFREGGKGTVLTGAFMPFGTATEPGQVVKGSRKAGGTILVFDPENAEATVQPYAWGFRNAIGIAWNRDNEMFIAVNGYDNAAGRPINDYHDGTYRVREGAWYGWPDFAANFSPVTDARFKPNSSAIPPTYKGRERVAKELHFLIDHKASGLEQPDTSLILGLHEVNASPSKPDVAPEGWGDYADHLFVPEYGDFQWITNPLRDKFAGNRIVRMKTSGSGEHTVHAFIQNEKSGPASQQGRLGEGIERPYDVKFGPDGAMYIVDFGSHRTSLKRIAEGHFPIDFDRGTGMVWRVAKTK
ncbi:sugar dehydrogenase [Pontibacter diazotrophicus]|uniref:Sugar dehydrogenase n=1 Tax=Pontibacter diazotrophicus TaxID=1400979 RepID=A0A3D8L228_9BACT|nr:sugar dehydrogenase [Pontibacter diazotrophicus]RDV11471.1 sugar dehydrogenase [Pontibacter diazotrophicus]